MTRTGSGGACWRLVAMLAIGLCATEALAQETVSPWAYRRLSKAQEALSKGDYEEALSHLSQMKERKRLNDHERALMWQTYGFLYSGQERFEEATAAFEACLALEAMPEGAQLNMQYNLGQLYLSTGRFADAIKTLEAWFQVAENPAPSAYFVLAMAYAQDKRYAEALRYGNRAVAGVQQPQEAWLQLVLSMQIQLERFGDAARLLEHLIERKPGKKSYWMQLSAVYGELGDSDRALAVMELAYREGFLTSPAEIVNLAQLYVQQGVPLRGAEVLEQGLASGLLQENLEHTRLLATCLMYARALDRAFAPLERAAAMADNGDLYVQLAQLHMGREDWVQAAAAVEAALAKGKLTDEGHAHLLQGIAYYSADQPMTARRAFERAIVFENTTQAAEQWLRALEGR